MATFSRALRNRKAERRINSPQENFPRQVKTKSLLQYLIVFTTLVAIAVSCDDETDTIGGSIMPGEDEMQISQAIYSVTSRSVKADSVLATTSESYLGKITDPETNATTICDFLAQFHILEDFTLPDRDSLVSDNGKIEADSVDIQLYISNFYGDSLNSMKLGVYELDTANVMKENVSYYSNLDPTKYLNPQPTAVKKELTFAVSDMTLSDSTKYSSSYSKHIKVKLPKEYGTFLMKKYYDNPENFKNSYNFINHVCPGFYFRTLAGNGTMLNIDVVALSVYFRYIYNDSVISGVQRMAATEEVLQNTHIENKNIDNLINAKDYTFVKTPACIFTEVTLPIDSIYNEEHINDTINSARISFTRRNNDSQSIYNLPIPQVLLMVKKDEMYEFFEDGKVADGATSFVSSFDSGENAYTFSNISALVSNIYKERQSGAGVNSWDTEAERIEKYKKWEQEHPNWNKVMLIPVVTTYNSLNVLTRVRNDLSLGSTRLVGGDTKDIKISVVYSRFMNNSHK